MSGKRIHGRIADNPSTKALADNLLLMKLARSVTGGLKQLGVSNENIDNIYSAADDTLQKADILTLPDRFNDAFANDGWIATGSMAVDTMRNAVRLYESGKKEEAEEELIAWFKEDTINLLAITRAKRFNKARRRWDQLREAHRLTFEERYWSAVPLILIACDGFASDVLGTSPFTENADLTVFDSIVGHPDSLQSFINQLTKGVRKSSDEELTLPLRHGILHGRSLGYANRVVCMKAWLLMIALVDWACDKTSEQSRIREHDSNTNISLRDLAIQAQKLDQDKREMAAFRPVEKTGPFDGPVDKDSPEYAIIDFLACWKRRNYGKMAERAMNATHLSIKKLAGQLRRDADLIELTEFTVHAVRQVTVARADAIARLEGRTLKRSVQGTFQIVAFRQNEHGTVAMPTDRGTWLVQQNVIFDFLHERTIKQKRDREL